MMRIASPDDGRAGAARSQLVDGAQPHGCAGSVASAHGVAVHSVFANGGTSSATHPVRRARDRASTARGCRRRGVRRLRGCGERASSVIREAAPLQSSFRYAANCGPRSSRSARARPRLEEVELLTDVVPAERANRAVDRCASISKRDRVRELQLAAAAGLDSVERFEDVGREEIPPADREFDGADPRSGFSMMPRSSTMPSTGSPIGSAHRARRMSSGGTSCSETTALPSAT